MNKYLEGDISPGEQKELFEMAADMNIDPLLAEMIEADFATDRPGEGNMCSQESEAILKKVMTSEKHTNRIFTMAKRKKATRRLSAVAMVVIILLGAAFIYFNRSQEISPVNFEVFIPAGNIKKTNTTSLPLIVVLQDGSSVKLAPRSTLSFPEHFDSEKREVYMTGEAFFVIAKNPASPFYVYYNNVVTKVLGTSFNIKTNHTNSNIEVSVVTGKVQVTENITAGIKNISGEALKTVVVTPNQKAVYNTKQKDFETTLADSIRPLLDLTNSFSNIRENSSIDPFYFHKATNLREVFTQIEAFYGLEIITTNEHIYDCVFTGDLSKQDIWKKLNILCLTIGANYEIKGTKILVSGDGCK